MKNKLIIIVTIVLFVISSFALAYIEKIQSDENLQKNWWVVYFNDPKSANFNFTIENHSQNEKFSWEISRGKEKIGSGNEDIAKGGKEIIELPPEKIPSKGKMTITVTDGNDKKQIYKNL